MKAESADPATHYDITLFEYEKRLGGRVRSQLIPPLGFRAELGAMRFHPTHHLLRALIEDLKVPVRPFDVPSAYLRVRGRTLSPSEVVRGACIRCGAGTPFLLPSEERGRSPIELVHGALKSLFRDLSFPGADVEEARFNKEALLEGSYSPQLWKFVREHGMYENIALRDIGFWNLLQHYLSNEAFSLVHTAMSLESVIGNWNAAEAIPWFMDDYSSADLWMVPGGLSRVIERMAAELEATPEVKSCNCGMDAPPPTQRADWKLHHSTTVKECIWGEDGWTILSAQKPPEGPFKHVIFAVPLKALEQIEIKVEATESAAQSVVRPEWLENVEAHRLFKVFLLYENPWWVSSGVPAGMTGRTSPTSRCGRCTTSIQTG
jgi:hypothetical protein